MSILCMLAPRLAVQVERRRNPSSIDKPMVIGGKPWQRGSVLDCCEKAMDAGVNVGMKLAQAEALCPTALFLPADQRTYQEAHAGLAAGVRDALGEAEAVDLGVLLARLRGDSSDDKATTEIAQRLIAHGHQQGLDTQIGVAANRFTARMAALAADPVRIVTGQQEREFLVQLPIGALPLDPESLRRLKLLGIATLGGYVHLPRPAIVEQFGRQGGFAYDLATGRDTRPVIPDRIPLVLQQAHPFDPPAYRQDQVCAAVAEIITNLTQRLTQHAQQAEALQIDLTFERHGKRQGEWTTAGAIDPPSAQRQLLVRRAMHLIRPAPPRPIGDLHIILYPLRPEHVAAQQLSLFDAADAGRSRRLDESISRLQRRFGEDVVMSAASLSPPPAMPVQVDANSGGWPRRVRGLGSSFDVVAVYEHWRTCDGWWAEPAVYDYYRVETDDEQVKTLRRTEQGQWYLERKAMPAAPPASSP